MASNIYFISGNYFGFQALKGLLESEEFKYKNMHISQILSLDVSQKESTAGFYDFSHIAKEYSIPNISIISSKHNGVAEIIENAKPDYLLVIGWSLLVSSEILNIPKLINNSLFSCMYWYAPHPNSIRTWKSTYSLGYY